MKILKGDGTSTDLNEQQLAEFTAAFRGSVLSAGDGEYDETRKIWNGMIDRKPALIARCNGTADVVRAVELARDHRLLVSVRSGGHNIAGTAVCEGGLMIDLSLMRGVWVDRVANRIHAQGGCTLGDVDAESQLHGLAAPLGFVSLTGIAGLTTGGGFGYMTRKHGWTCDNVASMEVVTASGEIVRASADENSELFWCLRGGSGNFGIVTKFEFEAHPVGPEVTAGAVAWRGEDANDVLSFYREFTSSTPRELSCASGMRIAPPAPWLPAEVHGEKIILMLACYNGDPAEGERLVAPIKSFGKPVADILVRRPYTQMQSLLDATLPKGRRSYWKSEYLGDLQPEFLSTAVDCAQLMPSPHSVLLTFQVDGALNELPADHSPAGNRDAKYVLNIASHWDDADNDKENIAWSRDTWEALRGYGTGGVYINFLTEEEGQERTQAAFGAEIFERLAALKRKYDPENLFSHTKKLTG